MTDATTKEDEAEGVYAKLRTLGASNYKPRPPRTHCVFVTPSKRLAMFYAIRASGRDGCVYEVRPEARPEFDATFGRQGGGVYNDVLPGLQSAEEWTTPTAKVKRSWPVTRAARHGVATFYVLVANQLARDGAPDTETNRVRAFVALDALRAEHPGRYDLYLREAREFVDAHLE